MVNEGDAPATPVGTPFSPVATPSPEHAGSCASFPRPVRSPSWLTALVACLPGVGSVYVLLSCSPPSAEEASRLFGFTALLSAVLLLHASLAGLSAAPCCSAAEASPAGHASPLLLVSLLLSGGAPLHLSLIRLPPLSFPTGGRFDIEQLAAAFWAEAKFVLATQLVLLFLAAWRCIAACGGNTRLFWGVMAGAAFLMGRAHNRAGQLLPAQPRAAGVEVATPKSSSRSSPYDCTRDT